MNIPGADLIQQIWIAQKHFPYGINELEQAKLTAFPAEKVRPPRIKECKAYIECRSVWSKLAGSSCLVLANVEAISARKDTGNLAIVDRAIALNRLVFLSYRESEEGRIWIFAEIGRIHTLTERSGKTEIRSERIGCPLPPR
jgi:flavin reductase (DIM6/NTAB) family NADH-FMN oxidoreductase RutF